MEDGVHFLKATVSFDCRLALWIGTDKLLEDGASHGSMLLFKMGITNFEERRRDFIAGGIKGEDTFKLAYGFLKSSLPIITFTQPILTICCKRQIREGAKKS